jgi:hypothetical protein
MRTLLMRCLQRDSRILIPALCLALLPVIPWASSAHDSSFRTRPNGEPIPQPLPFSHRSHSRLGLNCSACHAMEGRGGSAGFPSLALCLACHRRAKGALSSVGALLEGYEQRGEAIPWTRIYKIPDFVFFSHKEHLAAGATCTACHGAVEQRDSLKQEVPTSMESCMDCHRSQGASLACHFCHELNQ